MSSKIPISAALAKHLMARQAVNASRATPELKPVRSTRDAIDVLNDPTTKRVKGRTLPVGYQWDGRELPGYGKAAARRLRQKERDGG